jgi:hypothetical protein
MRQQNCLLHAPDRKLGQQLINEPRYEVPRVGRIEQDVAVPSE